MVETVAFEDLPTADLVIDSIYRGGRAGNVGDDPIAQLLPCGNQGGIRFKKRGNSYLLAVLYTTGLDPDWPDALDPETGLFTGSVRSQGASTLRRHKATSLVVYAAASSLISECQRVRKSRRCSVNATWAPPRRRTRKYCRSSSNALQKRDADSKLPKPCIG